ncbi:hypothetical protein [Maridesulfovibrio bastinii]|uniref:hypothetical protein n=1 Tax=Maridesulfovibrio bastinii TaxID=47157 RepID=UPI0003FC4127|nr:hypothetical protein [Maridesulfovibrio bastinii]
MIAREWKAKCPLKHKDGFIAYLYQTGIKDTCVLEGYMGAQIFTRDLENAAEIKLVTFWKDLECIKKYAGEDIGIARLYPEDYKYELDPDTFVYHYEVIENQWKNK